MAYPQPFLHWHPYYPAPQPRRPQEISNALRANMKDLEDEIYKLEAQCATLQSHITAKDGEIQQLQHDLQDRDNRLHNHRSASRPYVAVLIDGDSYLFDQYLHDDESDPSEDVLKLFERVEDYARSKLNSTNDIEYVAKLYLNKHGLSKTIAEWRREHGMQKIDFHRLIAKFGYCDSRLDVVDVGGRQNAADIRVIDHLQQYWRDKNCVQIILGITHDAGYADTLEEYADSPDASRITLLNSWTTRPCYLDLPFEIISWPNVFVQTKLHPSKPKHPPRVKSFGYCT